MTVDDVVKHVAETPGWELTTSGMLRRQLNDGSRACPISSLDDRESIDFHEVARRLDVESETITYVMLAADAPESPGHLPKRREYRRRLLEAAKLQEAS